MILQSLLLAAALTAPQPATPQAVVDGLIEADRAFSAAAADTDPASGLTAMMDQGATMPVPGKGIVEGRDAVSAALRSSSFAKGDRISWTPVRGGISADGTHGFTFGYMTLKGGDPRVTAQKYLSYWIKRPEGWRVAVFKQMPRPAGEVSFDLLPPSLPASLTPPIVDPAVLTTHRRSLADVEQQFSDEAQQIGLKAAFRKYGRPDAMNMYEGAAFTIGLDAITASFPDDTTSPLYWSAEKTLVASSGDLGVNIGTIHRKAPEAGKPASMPFFTIWRRDSPGDPWRYVAE
ncbi:DUF4440 domain-containing protein [Sphingosinicella humi]|uniref:DUF4440 domain-containing protein n=1 Tax=Allosphingosinicella humi TaxID=2068657 RepID=A0A2U2IZS3_9SPHN|nr:DUF4440 domain-containing protein [Sphingosinicella humi]PWG01567.1 hypothetical protein DF286_00785 [Sphingosinicella humi]